jgi:hypothetical protein
MNVATLSLLLPHDWFAAQTALPKNRFRMSRLRASGSAMNGLAARVTQTVADPMEFALSDSTLDAAQRLFDSYCHVERAAGAPVDMLRAAMAQALPICAADIEKRAELSEAQLETLARGLRASSPEGPLFLHYRAGQRPRTGKGQGKGRANCGRFNQARPRDPGRISTPAVQCI